MRLAVGLQGPTGELTAPQTPLMVLKGGAAEEGRVERERGGGMGRGTLDIPYRGNRRP